MFAIVPKFKNYTGKDLGQSFKTFYTKEKKRITEALMAMGCKDVTMSRQFYYISGYFTAPSGQLYYFSISDVRFFPYKQILYRTAKDYTDSTGGYNQYVDKDNISVMYLK
jgi:hypothetical protein